MTRTVVELRSSVQVQLDIPPTSRKEKARMINVRKIAILAAILNLVVALTWG